MGQEKPSDATAKTITATAGSANSKRGKLYLYRGGPGGLTTTAWATTQGKSPDELFAYALAAVGRSKETSGRVAATSGGWEQGRGRVSLFELEGRRFRPLWRASGPEGGGLFRWGFTLAAPGDLDGDGHGDLIVGNPVDDKITVFWGHRQGYHDNPLHFQPPLPPGGAAEGIRFAPQVEAFPGAGPEGEDGFVLLSQVRKPGQATPVNVARIYRWRPHL